MPFQSPTQQCQSKWIRITFHGLAHPSSPGDLQLYLLTTKGSGYLGVGLSSFSSSL